MQVAPVRDCPAPTCGDGPPRRHFPPPRGTTPTHHLRFQHATTACDRLMPREQPHTSHPVVPARNHLPDSQLQEFNADRQLENLLELLRGIRWAS